MVEYEHPAPKFCPCCGEAGEYNIPVDGSHPSYIWYHCGARYRVNLEYEWVPELNYQASMFYFCPNGEKIARELRARIKELEQQISKVSTRSLSEELDFMDEVLGVDNPCNSA